MPDAPQATQMASPAQIGTYLRKILNSSGFRSSERAGRLLEFLVDRVERGAVEISEFEIAARIFDRGDSFDPRVDSIVRVEASRTRVKLATYYETEGRTDPIEIYFPKKGYVPSFRFRSAGAATSKKAIGVLPLDSLYPGVDQDYFAAGLTDALITELAKVEGLRVISRTTMMQYKGTEKPMREIARDLNISHLVEGTVLRDGDRVRITLRLIQAPDDHHLWADSYELELKDVLELQRTVVHTVVRELRIRLTPEDAARLAPVSAVNPRAYESLLKGTYAWGQFSAEGFHAGLAFFERAIAEDPSYARAHAWLANALHVLAMHGFADPAMVGRKAEAAAKKAVELDASAAEAHAAVAACEAMRWNWAAAEEAFRHARRLNPGWAHGYHMYAVLCLLPSRRFGDALREMQRALDLDPLSLATGLQLGRIRLCRHEFDEALRILNETKQLNPNSAEAHRWFGDACFCKHLYGEAADAYDKARGLSPDPRDLWRIAQVHTACGRPDTARESINILKQICHDRYVAPSTWALTCLAAGDRAGALQWFARAVRTRDPLLPLITVLPACDGVRRHPQFAVVLRAVHGDCYPTRAVEP